MMPLRVLVLAVLAGALPVQTGNSRLRGRVPAEALPAVDSIVASAAAAGLPTEPLIEKALEGAAKKVPPDRIVSAVGAGAERLRAAHALAARGGSEPSDGEVEAIAAALARGLDADLATRLAAALPDEPPGPALHAVADMVGHGFHEDSSVSLIVSAAGTGLRGMRLLDAAAAAILELQRGLSHAAAIDAVRHQLPDVPLPPRPTPVSVSHAKRVPT